MERKFFYRTTADDKWVLTHRNLFRIYNDKKIIPELTREVAKNVLKQSIRGVQNEDEFILDVVERNEKIWHPKASEIESSRVTLIDAIQIKLDNVNCEDSAEEYIEIVLSGKKLCSPQFSAKCIQQIVSICCKYVHGKVPYFID